MNTTTENTSKEIHIGNIVKQYLKQKHIAQAVLGRRMQAGDTVVLYFLKKPNFNTSNLMRMSHALKRNLFADVAEHLPDTYSRPEPTDTTKDEQIATLKRENEILKAQLELLQNVLRK